MSRAAAFDRYRSDAVETMSPGRLVVALYERLMLDLDRALTAIAEARLEACHAALVHAQDIVSELADSLDTSQWPAGERLAELYRFLHEQLVRANVSKQAAPVSVCRQIVEPLLAAWRDAAGIVPNPPVQS